jgi:hypothetical protein
MSKRTADNVPESTKKVKAEICLNHTTQLSAELIEDGNELDNIVVHLEPELILVVLNYMVESIVQDQLRADGTEGGDEPVEPNYEPLLSPDDLSCMASVNWTWFMLFHGKHNLWLELATMRMGVDKKGSLYPAKFQFVFQHFEASYGEERCPGALVFRLNQGLLSVCPYCKYDTEMQGKGNVPLSAVQLTNGKYCCMNPGCRRELNRRMCDFALTDVFAACLHSVSTKTHKWIALDTEFLLPGSNKAMDTTFEYCERCGLLQEDASLVEENVCSECLEAECECVPCHLCKKMPAECRCEACETCGRCTGCKNCKRKRTCKCEYCDTCDMPIDSCECSSEYEF